MLGTFFAGGKSSVHLFQLELTEFNAHWFSVHTAKKVPNMIPYCSGFPIDSIPPIDPLYPDLPRQKQAYQGIFGCINWLATWTLPNIAPALKFLALYRNAPHPQHYKATVHTLKYLTSTNEYGISFHSQSYSTIKALKYLPHHHDKEAYTEVTATSPS